MMTLHDLKIPYENMVKSLQINLKTVDVDSLIDELQTCDDFRKDQIYAILVCKSWQALVNAFYKKGKSNLSAEECYDVYLEALDYIITMTPWRNKDNSLYGDPNAFIKAMMQCTYSRKLNYIIAQHRQKRLLHTNAVSIDALNENFQEGYFSSYNDSHENIYLQEINGLIKKFFSEKDYLTGFILDSILNIDIFNDNQEVDLRKVHKHLRNLSDDYCIEIAKLYDLNPDEVKYSRKYFDKLSTSKLDGKLDKCLQILKCDFIIKQEVEKI